MTKPKPAAATAAPASPARQRLIETGHLAVLAVFAVALPLFELVRQDPTFFVARRSQRIDVHALAWGLVLGLPLALMLVELVVGLVSAKARRVTHVAFVALLVALVFLPQLRRMTGVESLWVVGAALAVGLVASLLYARSTELRFFLTILSPVPIVFALMFLWDEGVRRATSTGGGNVVVSNDEVADTTVVFLIVDELPVASLLDEEHRIDPVMFPNFAALAEDSTWYRNATAVHESTTLVIPAILSGLAPTDTTKLPIPGDHPDNLFTLLGGSHRMRVRETVTRVCPPELLDHVEPTDPFGDRMTSLGADLGLGYCHLALPTALTADLPSVSGNWAGFWDAVDGPGSAPPPAADHADDHDAASGEVARETPAEVQARMLSGTHEDRVSIFRDFNGWVDSETDPTFYFLHILLPHHPWVSLPSARRYFGGERQLGVVKSVWTDEWLTMQGFQRHMLQTGAVDRLLGEFVAELKQQGVYDDCMLVLVADHGMCFRTGEHRRQASELTVRDILHVPLFIKRPGQTEGRISDRNVDALDVLPTIADELGITPSWALDGRVLPDDELPERPTKTLHVFDADPIVVDGSPPESYTTLDYKHALFGANPTWDDVWAMTPLPALASLVGRPLDELELGEPTGARATVDGPQYYADFDPTAEIVPSFVLGKVADPIGAPPPEHLAVAVNGTVRAVTRSFDRSVGEASFSAMVRDDAFVPGYNAIEILAVGDDGVLLPLSVVTQTLTTVDGGEAIRSSDGRVRLVAPGNSYGVLDLAKRYQNDLRLYGWARHPKGELPVDRILVFVDDTCVMTGVVDIERGTSGITGFLIDVPYDLLDGRPSGRVRVFAEVGDEAHEVRYTRPTHWLREVHYSLDESGTLVNSDGVSFRMRPLRVRGWLDSVVDLDEQIRVRGWAALEKTFEPADTIVVLADGQHVYAGPPNFERADLVEPFGAEAIRDSGYVFDVRRSWFPESLEHRIRVFAISGEHAAELEYGTEAGWAVPVSQEPAVR